MVKNPLLAFSRRRFVNPQNPVRVLQSLIDRARRLRLFGGPVGDLRNLSVRHLALFTRHLRIAVDNRDEVGVRNVISNIRRVLDSPPRSVNFHAWPSSRYYR